MIEMEDYMADSAAWRIWESIDKYPDYPALELEDRQYSYRELALAASSISDAINELGDTQPYIAVMADKSFACYSGILGILLAGKAYLPLNPKFPAARNLYMLEKAGIRLVLAGEDSDEELEQILENYRSEVFIIFPEETDQIGNPEIKAKIVAPDDPAYLLFTSGTTGKPKGVPVSHRNLGCYLDNMLRTYDFGTDDRFTQIFDLTFDLSVHDMFLAWSTGACLVVPKDNSSFAMSSFIREKMPTVWFSVPSVVTLMDRMRLLKAGAFPSIRISFFCGEALQVKTALSWQNSVPQSRIINLYGPTEATIAITQYEIPVDQRPPTADRRPPTADRRPPTANRQPFKEDLGIVSIGKIFERNVYAIIKENPTDDRGELCLSGEQVVSGYLENEQADREAFFIDGSSEKKYYRTGDLVKEDEAGDLFYMGRKDSEVKISGYRVNLKEIENLLEGYEKVQQAVVIYEQPGDTAGGILAFILGSFNDLLQAEKDMDALCREYLPWYMVPGKFIFVNEIPLNANGKVDKNALKQTFYNGN